MEQRISHTTRSCSSGPAARADWGGYTGAFSDPEGYVWEVAHNPDWTLTVDGSVRLT